MKELLLYRFHLFTVILNVALSLWLWFYLAHLQKTCSCAITREWSVLITYFAFSLVYILVVMNADPQKMDAPMLLMFTVFFFMTLLFIRETFAYIKKMRQRQCSCSEGVGQMVLFILAVVRLIGLLLVFTFFLFMLLTVALLTNGKRRGK